MNTLQNSGRTEAKWITPRMKGLFMTLAGAFCFSLIPIWIRSIEAYSSMSIAFFRALIGMIFLFFWIMQRRETGGIVEVRLLGWKYKLVLICVGFAMCVTPVTYYFAIMKTSV